MNDERQSETIEVSVVIPCLNEEETLAQCIEKVVQRPFLGSEFCDHAVPVVLAGTGCRDRNARDELTGQSRTRQLQPQSFRLTIPTS